MWPGRVESATPPALSSSGLAPATGTVAAHRAAMEGFLRAFLQSGEARREGFRSAFGGV
jgi:hypothetical protein